MHWVSIIISRFVAPINVKQACDSIYIYIIKPKMCISREEAHSHLCCVWATCNVAGGRIQRAEGKTWKKHYDTENHRLVFPLKIVACSTAMENVKANSIFSAALRNYNFVSSSFFQVVLYALHIHYKHFSNSYIHCFLFVANIFTFFSLIKLYAVVASITQNAVCNLRFFSMPSFCRRRTKEICICVVEMSCVENFGSQFQVNG